MKNQIKSSGLLIGGLLLLAGCAAAATAPAMVPQLVGLDGVSVLGTGKTITDHIVSFSSGKNCSTIRKNRGQHYCEEDEVSPPPNVYCYRSLGDVNCFSTPAPHGETQRQVGTIAPGSGPTR